MEGIGGARETEVCNVSEWTSKWIKEGDETTAYITELNVGDDQTNRSAKMRTGQV